MNEMEELSEEIEEMFKEAGLEEVFNKARLDTVREALGKKAKQKWDSLTLEERSRLIKWAIKDGVIA